MPRSLTPGQTGASRVVAVRVTTDTIDMIDELVELEERPRADVLRDALTAGLQHILDHT